ncbi:hypothetical protein FGG08_005496 [Glutinoglossum americanum]|uniref:Uncharacterized protein n=1 Tax=Glutinoglossum americanum TaxID=1670608 RepID=A0A9P8I348_9PEZI|nr:hypothetical protein FGG08_005496 [Glutinoglossum americanum]
MVLGLLTIASIPTLVGTCEAVSEQKKQNAEAKRSEKFNLAAACDVSHRQVEEQVDGRFVVLRDGKLYLDHEPKGSDMKSGHPFCGYYFQYPGAEFEGLVSTISDDPPMLNWIYIDRDTRELKYGNRTQTLPHIAGPWDWTEDEKWLKLEDQEAFVVMEVEDGIWRVYYDKEGDWSGLPSEGKILDVQLQRKPLCGLESKHVRC